MKRIRMNQKYNKMESKIIEDTIKQQCFFCQMKELPRKKGKVFIKICDLCQKKLEMLNQYARPWDEVVKHY